MLRVRYPRFWLVIGWLGIAAAIIVCLVPGNELPNTGMSDKTEHFLCYASLMCYFSGLYPRSRYWVIAIGLLFMGIAIEFAQNAMHLGRVGDVGDAIANTIGVAIGLILSLAGVGRWTQWVESLAGIRAPVHPE